MGLHVSLFTLGGPFSLSRLSLPYLATYLVTQDDRLLSELTDDSFHFPNNFYSLYPCCNTCTLQYIFIVEDLEIQINKNEEVKL